MATRSRGSSSSKPTSARTRKKSAGRKSRGGRQVYFFGDGRAAGRASMRDRLGGKGANLAEMTRLGIPVPAGFTLSTELCHLVNRVGGAALR